MVENATGKGEDKEEAFSVLGVLMGAPFGGNADIVNVITLGSHERKIGY